MSALKMALLGPPEVDHREHRLIFSDRKGPALLAYLATEGGVHERHKLTRLYWYQRVEQVFDWLSQLQSAEGALEQAIETVERWRCFDPLNEDIALRLMQLQFASGNRTAALKTYQTYQDILMTELSATPSRKVVTLAEVLRNASPPRGAHRGAGRCTTNARTLLNVPFVGRGAQVSRLMTLYGQASSGQPQVVLLEGEAGIGKTRLAAAFLDLARTQGANVLTGRTFHTSQRLSYQPLIVNFDIKLPIFVTIQ